MDFIISDEDCGKIERAAEMFGLIAEATDRLRPGEYHIETTFPDECREYTTIAREFRASNIPELSHFGYRMQALLREVTETDRTYRHYPADSRTARRQLGLMRKAIEKTLDAAQLMRKAIEKTSDAAQKLQLTERS